MSETPVCEVCGQREAPAILIGGIPKTACWRAWPGNAAHGREYETLHAYECYRLGYERARAALSAAEKERDEARSALARTEPLTEAARLYVGARRIAKTVTVRDLMGGGHVSALEAQDLAVVGLYRAAHAYVAALELASAASAAPAAPTSSPDTTPETA